MYTYTRIVSLARTSCRLLFTTRPSARPLAGNPLRDVVRSRNPSKSTLAHDAVATAVLHKHHLIIRVGAGLIQFVCRSHLRLATPSCAFLGPRELTIEHAASEWNCDGFDDATGNAGKVECHDRCTQ